MMKKTGYRGEFAGAVEAAAGGQIMPPSPPPFARLSIPACPIPGSPLLAILPAVLYFTGGLYIAVHLEAKRLAQRA